VTFLGHWKGHTIFPADILHVSKIAQRIEHEDSRVCTKIRSIADMSCVQSLAEDSAEDTVDKRVALAKQLNVVVGAGEPLFQVDGGTELVLTERELWEFNRQNS
jgi:hypothetical protein